MDTRKLETILRQVSVITDAFALVANSIVCTCRITRDREKASNESTKESSGLTQIRQTTNHRRKSDNVD